MSIIYGDLPFKKGKKISVALAGSVETDTGQKTRTLVEQINGIKDLEIKAFYNKDKKAAEEVLAAAGVLKKFSYAGEKNSYNENSIYTDSMDLFVKTGEIDAYIITEINAAHAAEIIYNCLINGKKVINLNAISEVTLGLAFKKIAEENNTIYSVGAGDEPAATLELINYCNMLGLEVICAGKGKNNPLNVHSNPDNFIQKGKEMDVSPYLIASFVDGTKTMLEMAILSNAAGFSIDVDGMHGPKADIKDLINVFKLKKDGGILKKCPVIDYAIGDIAPGVFVVFTSRQKSIIEELIYLKMGNGPNFLLYKPYHLGNIESPLSIYDLVCGGRPTLTVKNKYLSTVAAKAKKDLKAGEKIDFSGGYSFYGYAVDFEIFNKAGYAPIGLIEDSTAVKDIKKDDVIKFDDIELNKNNIMYKLWGRQKKLF